MTENNEEIETGEVPETHQAEPTEEEPRRAWWAVPLALAGAVLVKYMAKRGEEKPPEDPRPAGKGDEPEQIKDADFKVIE